MVLGAWLVLMFHVEHFRHVFCRWRAKHVCPKVQQSWNSSSDVFPFEKFSNLVAFTAHFITANPWLKGTDPLKVRGFEKVELGSAFPKGDAAKRSELLALAQHQQEEPASHCG